MKHSWIYLTCLTGCMANNGLQYDSVAENNLYHIARVRKGMGEKEVLQIMHKPYSYESFIAGEDVYDVWFYVTKPTGLGQSRMVPQNLTPLTFKNGILVGTGYSWYYFAMKEQAAEIEAESPQEPRKTQDQEDKEFEDALNSTKMQNAESKKAPAPTPPENQTKPSWIQRMWKSKNTSLSASPIASAKVKLNMSDEEVSQILGQPQRTESYTLNNDTYEIWFYKNPNKPLIFKNGVLVSTSLDRYQKIKQEGEANQVDSFDRKDGRMIEDESEQNFDYW